MMKVYELFKLGLQLTTNLMTRSIRTNLEAMRPRARPRTSTVQAPQNSHILLQPAQLAPLNTLRNIKAPEMNNRTGMFFAWSAAALTTLAMTPSADCARSSSPILANKYVVVHVWRPKNGHAAAAPIGGDTGHVSLSIYEGGKKTEYISFWPKGNGKKVNQSQGEFIDFETDVASEEREPDVNIILYSLDTQAIKQFYQSVKDKWIRWVPTKKLPDDTKLEREQNCATMAWKGLLAGGIAQQYAPDQTGPGDSILRNKYGIKKDVFSDAPWRSLISTPMLILHLASSVKEQELKAHQKTRLWDKGAEQNVVSDQAKNKAKTVKQGVKKKMGKMG